MDVVPESQYLRERLGRLRAEAALEGVLELAELVRLQQNTVGTAELERGLRRIVRRAYQDQL